MGVFLLIVGNVIVLTATLCNCNYRKFIFTMYEVVLIGRRHFIFFDLRRIIMRLSFLQSVSLSIVLRLKIVVCMYIYI